MIPVELKRQLETDLTSSYQGWWPVDLGEYLLNQFQIDIRARYAGQPIKNPFGKGSGQLTMTPHQIAEAADAGLGFAVLKTVIAQDSAGHQSMSDWALAEARMIVEPVQGKHSKRDGWTVTWKGRGWSRSFEDYLALFRDSLSISNETGIFIAPSVKFHLPGNLSEEWRISEYEYVLYKLSEVWQKSGKSNQPMPIEKDFSPTLAGDDRSRLETVIVRWINEILPVIRQSVPFHLTIGLKLMNTLGTVSFQKELLRVTLEIQKPADFLIYANRLFDVEKTFEGHCGVAYGGPDLSDRNIAILELCKNEIIRSGMEISGTGDVDSGRAAVEYALRGCQSVQLHTYFQTPEFEKTGGSGKRLRRKLAKLIFDPEVGLVAWLIHARIHWGLIDENGISRWLDLPKTGLLKELN
ncbi:MAG: hypothetical protein ACKO5E_10535 [bacterium]